MNNLLLWSDLPEERKKCGYWVAVPHDEDSILDGLQYEVVYVYFNGKWFVMRMADNRWYALKDFRFSHLLEINLNDSCEKQ